MKTEIENVVIITIYNLKMGGSQSVSEGSQSVSEGSPIVCEYHGYCKNGNIDGIKNVMNYKLLSFENEFYKGMAIAAENNQFDTVKYLFSNGCGILGVKYKDYIALRYAINNSAIDVVKFLLEHGGKRDIFLFPDSGQPPVFFIALKFGTLEIVKMIYEIDNIIFKNSVTSNGYIGLKIACQNKRPEVIRFILDLIGENNWKEAVSESNYKCVAFAAETGNLETMKMLFDIAGDVRKDIIQKSEYSISLNATKSGNLEFVKFIYENDGSKRCISYGDYHMVSIAISFGYLDIVKYLVSNGEMILSKICSNFRDACVYGQLEIIKFFFEHYNPLELIRFENYDFLFDLSAKGYIKIISYIYDFLVSKFGESGKQEFQIAIRAKNCISFGMAVRNNHEETVYFLYDCAGENRNEILTSNNYFPLMAACNSSHNINLVRFCYEHSKKEGYHPNQCIFAEDFRALRAAIRNDSFEIIDYLCSKLSPNEKDSLLRNNFSILLAAVKDNDFKSIQFLREKINFNSNYVYDAITHTIQNRNINIMSNLYNCLSENDKVEILFSRDKYILRQVMSCNSNSIKNFFIQEIKKYDSSYIKYTDIDIDIDMLENELN